MKLTMSGNLTEKQKLLNHIAQLEFRADHYSRVDWDIYMSIRGQLCDANQKLVDILTKENEEFLQTIQDIA
jgi:hypothetical protein